MPRLQILDSDSASLQSFSDLPYPNCVTFSYVLADIYSYTLLGKFTLKNNLAMHLPMLGYRTISCRKFRFMGSNSLYYLVVRRYFIHVLIINNLHVDGQIHLSIIKFFNCRPMYKNKNNVLSLCGSKR